MADLERITTVAQQAAEDGRWDIVDECYRARGHYLEDTVLSPEEAERLLTMDHAIQARVQLRQAALAALMHEPARIRQRLKGLHQGAGTLSSESGTICLKA